MYGVLMLAFILSVSADNLFNYKLYKDVLDPEMCKLQVKSMSHEFYDASFRTPEGLLNGNFASLGHYHQCLAINQEFPGKNIQGKYCLIRSPMTLPIIRLPTLSGVSISETLTWTEMTLPPHLKKAYRSKSLALAVCVPKTCTVDAMLAPYARNPVVRFNYSEEYCRLPNDRPFVTADYVAIFVFSLIALLTVVSTAYDLRHNFMLRKDPKQASELYCACSLYTNTRRLLALSKPRPIDCLDGIRSLSILWIILYHTYCTYFFYSNYVVNSLEAFEWSYKRHTMWIISDTVAVDSFFTLGGLLLAYSTAKKITRSSLIKNLHKIYLGRYMRLFPLLAAAVLLQASLIHRVADGPNWHYMADHVELCRRYWWSALLHVQNIVNSFDMCLPQTWYLSVDMQLHIVSPLILYWFWGSRRTAYTALVVPIVCSLVVTLLICFSFNFITSRIAQSASQQEIREHVMYYYQNTATRSAPFFVGMLCGYILHVYKGKKWSLVACYTLALATLFYAIYIVHPSLQTGWKDHFSDNIHNSFRRVFWPLALCWLIFACIHGFGGPVNWFLSMRLWKFVARVSYGMFLYHYMVQYTFAGAEVAPVYFNVETMLTLFASDVVYTVLVASVACVVIEEPFFTLQGLLLAGVFKPQQKQTAAEGTPAPDGASSLESKSVSGKSPETEKSSEPDKKPVHKTPSARELEKKSSKSVANDNKEEISQRINYFAIIYIYCFIDYKYLGCGGSHNREISLQADVMPGDRSPKEERRKLYLCIRVEKLR